jgi:thiol-disulfide isomerase/thioredoxin
LPGAIIKDVRDAIAQGQFERGEALIAEYRKASGITPEMLEALSWLGRGALAKKQYDQAERYARETYQLCVAELRKRPLDQEKNLPIALGASIEVQAQVMAGRGARDQGVEYLKSELKKFYATSIRTRLQKNVHLLDLEGKPAPPLETKPYLGAAPPALAALRGKPVVLLFWAHWCGDCKYQAPLLAKLRAEFAPSGLTVLGPTQHYGYVARGEEAAPDVETKYIDEVRKSAYGALEGMPVPLSEENFRSWGASTTPTLVFIDRQGKVVEYHPGKMTEAELRASLEKIVR